MAKILPQNPTINANIMSNIENNKIVEKSFITNNNIEMNGESSNGSNVKTLQNVSLKEVNNGIQTVECNHTSGPQNGFCESNVFNFFSNY